MCRSSISSSEAFSLSGQEVTGWEPWLVKACTWCEVWSLKYWSLIHPCLKPLPHALFPLHKLIHVPCRISFPLHPCPLPSSPPFQVISKSSEVMEEAATEEKYLIATSEQPLCALHRWSESRVAPIIRLTIKYWLYRPRISVSAIGNAQSVYR